jgi:hypothetical protein
VTSDARAGELNRQLAAGYEYQDVIAALAMARALVEGWRSVGVVVPAFAGDTFDDVVVVAREGVEERVQVKHSAAAAPLAAAEFRAASGRVPIADLMASALATDASQYRLLSNWSAPADAERAGFLIPSGASRLDPTLSTTLWRIDAEAIWPAGGDQRWTQLNKFTRDDFVAFCGRFVIELDAPAMSASLSEPGPLEMHLLRYVRERLEVERHPNRRRAFDMAAQLVSLATALRSRTVRSLSRSDILRELQLIVDQAPLDEPFPIEPTQYVDPPAAVLLSAAAAQDGIVILVGPPGSGKSWTLEGLAADLRKAGSIVARHYCFVRPGDPAIGQRIELVTMSENLIAELREDERLAEIDLGFARDPAALAAFLARAAKDLRAEKTGSQTETPRIVLIVDGLDHVMRVGRVSSPNHIDEFIETLQALKPPAGTTLILGSQPGAFLDPLFAAGAHGVRIPSFGREEVVAQLSRLGVPLDGLSNQERERLVDVVVERSAGNPLYVRFLAQQILSAIADRRSIDEVLLSGAATPSGDLAAYYEWLVGPEDTIASLIVERLALVDFLVTPDELSAILADVGRPRIDGALTQLRPILNESVAGVRLYHDSLRQFVLSRVERDQRSVEPLLAPVISWLESRGFYEDDRAYRYLLPSLRRAGRHRELLDRLTPEFVARTVSSLHPEVAAETNVREAALSARDLADAPALARLSELRRTITSTYQRLEPTEFASTLIALHGPGVIAGRLLFEGRPVFDKWTGLRLCAIVDAAGGVAPWAEYLALPGDPPRGYDDRRNQAELDQLRAFFRTRPQAQMATRVAKWLGGEAQESASWYVRGAAELYREVYGTSALSELVDATDSSVARASFALELADAKHESGDDEAAKIYALAAVADGLPLADLFRAVAAGAPATELVARVPDPAELLRDLLQKDYVENEGPAAKFISSVLVHAAAGNDLTRVRPMLEGAGWYRQWLRFIVDLGRVRQGSVEITAAFTELVHDAAPFTGKPRAVDLYRLHDTVADTIALGFEHATRPERVGIVARLIELTRLLTTKLQNSPTGPFTIWNLLALVERHPQPELVEALRAEVTSRQIADVYEVHADTELRMARLEKLGGNNEQAAAHWSTAARYLAAYGFRKDITVFGLIHGLEALARADADARTRALRMRPLADLALYHSDGSETHAAPGFWFKVFAQVDPVLAARTMTETLIRDARIPSDRDDGAFEDVLVHAPSSLDPLVLHLLWRTLPAHSHIRDRLAAVRRLREADPARGEEALREVAAAVEGDTSQPEMNVAQLADLAAADGLTVDGLGRIARPRESAQSSAPLMPEVQRPKPRTEGPFLPPSPSPFELLIGVRDARLNAYDAPIDRTAFAAEFRTHVRRIVRESGAAPMVLVAQEYVRRNHYFEGQDLAEVLAQELEGESPTAAAEAYTLAWCAERKYADYFGDHDSPLLAKARALDPAAVRKRLLDEVAAVVDTDEYASGITRRIVEVMVELGDVATATAAWDSAFDVISYRLPDLGVERDIFRVPPDPDVVLTVGDAYGALVGAAAAHPVYERRSAALGAIAELSDTHVGVALAAVTTLLTPGTALTDEILALSLITQSTALRERAREHLRDQLVARASPDKPFAVAMLAADILGPDAARPARPYVFTNPNVTDQELRHAIGNDYDGRIETLSSAWSELPVVIAARCAAARRTDSSIDDIRDQQAEVQISRSAPWVPPLALHDWWRETLERALQEELWGLRATLASRGVWSGRREQDVLRIVLPDAKTSAARARSRIVRPALDLPASLQSRDGPVVIEKDGPMAGWVRIGYWEQQILTDDRFSSGTEFSVSSGVVLDDADAPWISAPRLLQWFDLPLASHDPTDDMHLVAFSGQQDCTAWSAVLLPTPLVLRTQPLTARSPSFPLDLVDAEGLPAVSCRCWSMWPFDFEYGPRTPTLTGAGLWLRSDLFQRVAEAHSATTKTTVKREALKRTPET